MVDVVISQHARYRNSLLDTFASLRVGVWDIGPERPIKPAKPVMSKTARPGSVEYDIEQIELRSAVENYEKQLTHYLAQLKDHDSWHRRHSGPVVSEMWSVDWRDAQRHDTAATAEGRQRARRYYRYDPKAPRLGLPVGVEPGRSHAEQIERHAADVQALEVVKADDPQFGSQR